MGYPDRPLWSLSARELSLAYADGLSPDEVIAATLARIDEINPQLNAIVTLDTAGAFSSAEASARRWKAGRSIGPLDGVPVTIKDNILAAGLRATWGSRLYRDFIPDTDETPVARLREAGAVILGKTNVPEFTLHGFTDNELFGVTGNPWNPAFTPGRIKRWRGCGRGVGHGSPCARDRRRRFDPAAGRAYGPRRIQAVACDGAARSRLSGDPVQFRGRRANRALCR
jgi:hypothetical protein